MILVPVKRRFSTVTLDCNTAPRDSVLLLDEPELHLNPRLIRGLPRFYKEHLGDDLGNQIWLVTHSDTFLREAVGEPDFSVYHMQPPQAITGDENQVDPVLIEADVERAVMDLVGDLASYRPGGKVVIFEGGDSEFDLKMTNTLFPEFQVAVNRISSGNKKRESKLYIVCWSEALACGFQKTNLKVEL